MYAKSTTPSTMREVQKERSAKRDDRIARPRRAQTCERSELRAMRMCPRSGQIFLLLFYYDFIICGLWMKNVHNFSQSALVFVILRKKRFCRYRFKLFFFKLKNLKLYTFIELFPSKITFITNKNRFFSQNSEIIKIQSTVTQTISVLL